MADTYPFIQPALYMAEQTDGTEYTGLLQQENNIRHKCRDTGRHGLGQDHIS